MEYDGSEGQKSEKRDDEEQQRIVVVEAQQEILLLGIRIKQESIYLMSSGGMKNHPRLPKMKIITRGFKVKIRANRYRAHIRARKDSSNRSMLLRDSL